MRDGDVKTACQTACPTHAIVFGDGNDKTSEVTMLNKNPRTYKMLEELHVLPGVGYLTKVRNKDKVETLANEEVHDNHS